MGAVKVLARSNKYIPGHLSPVMVLPLHKIRDCILLAGCVPLANRLAALGVEIELTETDRSALAGFNQVWLYEDGWWLDDPDIHRQAGLDRGDINALGFVLARVQAEKMRRQHEAGEQLD